MFQSPGAFRQELSPLSISFFRLDLNPVLSNSWTSQPAQAKSRFLGGAHTAGCLWPGPQDMPLGQTSLSLLSSATWHQHWVSRGSSSPAAGCCKSDGCPGSFLLWTLSCVSPNGVLLDEVVLPDEVVLLCIPMVISTPWRGGEELSNQMPYPVDEDQAQGSATL